MSRSGDVPIWMYQPERGAVDAVTMSSTSWDASAAGAFAVSGTAFLVGAGAGTWVTESSAATAAGWLAVEA
ncbi:hypothetical protein D3C87_1918040 [compost metagenome]